MFVYFLDAFINNSGQGSFTYCVLKTLKTNLPKYIHIDAITLALLLITKIFIPYFRYKNYNFTF